MFVYDHLNIFLSFLREINFLFTLFSGDEKALMQWENNMAAAGRAFTVPENLSGYEGINLRRRSSEMQLVSGRNVVLNYGAVPPFDRSSKQTLIYLIFSNVYYLKKKGSATRICFKVHIRLSDPSLMHMPKLFTTYMAPIFFKLMQLFFLREINFTSRFFFITHITPKRNNQVT